MALTAASPPNEIEALFSWNPPRLNPGATKKTLSSTRPPSFYDKHFSRDLVLRRVERLPSLVRALANNVDVALHAASGSLPPLDDDGFITAQRRRTDFLNYDVRAKNKKAVADFYNQTTAKYCSPLASTLALHPTASFSQWTSLLSWTQSVDSSGYAITDGVLRFLGDSGSETIEAIRADIVKGMEGDKRRIIEEMRESESPLATWEIKHLSAGPVEVMTAVPNLGKFSWTFCKGSNCLAERRHQKAIERVKAVVVGPDARVSPWRIPDDSSNGRLDPGNRVEEIDLQLPSALDHAPTKDKGQKRKRDDDSNDDNDDNDNDERDGDDDNEDDNDDEAYKDRHDITAQSLVQQAWAQSVQVDGTIIILHSGNHELVCVRHRGSQTLYVSDIIEPPTCVNPGYGKLHVGIYIAAIQDAMDRKQQQLSNITQQKPSGDGGNISGGGDDDQNNRKPNQGSGSGYKGHGRRGGRCGGGGGRGLGKGGSAKKKDPTVDCDEMAAIEKAIQVASNRNLVLIYLKYDVYDSPNPALFLRSAPSIVTHTACPDAPLAPRSIHTYGPEECLTVILTSEIGHGATGIVHRGTLEPGISDGGMPLDVVVKLAFGFEQRDALKSEYGVYYCLRSNGICRGIATPLGFFDDSDGGACALIMPYAGVPLDEVPRCNLSISDRESAISTLESIHRAGILHGDIRGGNILISDSGVTVIDFGHSEQSNDQGAGDEEVARLRYLLGMKRKITRK